MVHSNEGTSGQAIGSIKKESLENILRVICMLEKELDRIARRNYHKRDEYPEIFFQIESMLNTMRAWIKLYGKYSDTPVFNDLLSRYLKEVAELIGMLIVVCVPVAGKKNVKKDRLIRERARLVNSIDDMISHIEDYLNKLVTNETEIEVAVEKALIEAFKKHCTLNHEKEIIFSISGRGNKTYIFPWSDRVSYLFLVKNSKRFRSEVVDELKNFKHATGHKPTCKCKENYRLRGFRSSDRKPIVEGGKQQTFPIRMIECVDCGQRFSLLPSFLPREKHFSIDIIGRIVQGIVLFGHSLRSALKNFKLTGTELKSKQTLLNWLRCFGTLCPATILTRAGVKGSGYFQEDEGFEKESGLRTYTVAMVDPENLLVWHLDYVDHVDLETLTESFEKFVERIDFKVIGVSKDKWKPATEALRTTFFGLWIGFCHRHCLKKIRNAFSDYQKETGCSSKEVGNLFEKFRKILDNATSAVNLKIKINALKDDAFNYPPVRRILNQVIEDGANYTCHKKRKGIKKTTSLVDNFLKIVKRKFRQVESFRDKEYTKLLFRAMANVRNFVPFMSGAKNAHKSPFMLAQGETFNLPWIQTMNVHNAFLFTENAI